MSALGDKSTTRRGAEVAKELGWPEDQIGFAGALSGLFDIGSDYQRPRSSRRLLKQYRARSEASVHARVVESIRSIYS